MRQAVWHRHVNAVAAPPQMRAWLTAQGSLTARLTAHSHAFRVQRLHQRTALCLADEARVIGLRGPGQVWEREVLLRCDDAPVVFAHTVVPLSATASDWPLFNALGERSLGSTLFYDPLVTRGQLEFARLRAGHPLLQRACAALGDGAAAAHTLITAASHTDLNTATSSATNFESTTVSTTVYYARRCLYRRRQGTLLVTEVFLPPVLLLAARPLTPAK